jgi:hypothetical protein
MLPVQEPLQRRAGLAATVPAAAGSPMNRSLQTNRQLQMQKNPRERVFLCPPGPLDGSPGVKQWRGKQESEMQVSPLDAQGRDYSRFRLYPQPYSHTVRAVLLVSETAGRAKIYRA